jgi:hypothetical protein
VISQQNLAGENRVRPVAARTLLAARRGASTSGRPPSKSAASAVQAMAEAGNATNLGTTSTTLPASTPHAPVRSATTSTVACDN